MRRRLATGAVLEVAQTADARRRLRLESAARSWAEHRGIPVPRVLESDPQGRWLVSEWIDAGRPAGDSYVDAAVAVAARLAAQPELPAGTGEASRWRAPRRSTLERGLRVVAGGVPPRLWIAARRQAWACDGPRVVSHGDFHPGNVLATTEGVAVVDWEFMSLAPRHSDLLRLWTVLPEPTDRDRLLGLLIDGRTPAERRRVGALLLWLGLRLLGENLTAAPCRRDPETLRHARAMLPEVTERARQLGAWPL